MKKEHYSNFGPFEIDSLVNVPGHYLRKYGSQFTVETGKTAETFATQCKYD